MKIKYKIAAAFSLICAGIIGAICIFIYILVARNNTNHFNKNLLERAFTAAEVSLEKDELSERQYRNLTRRYLRNLPQEEEEFYLVVNNQLPLPKETSRFYNKKAFEQTLLNGHALYRTEEKQAASIYYEDNEGNFIVVLAAVDEEGIRLLDFLKNTLFATVLISLILILIISISFARQILRPINHMIREVENISANNLTLRLEEGKGRDEISRLARNFNKMLGRIEQSFDIQRNFVQNASHELRTPLTVILGESHFALNSKDQEKSEEALKKINQEANHLNDLFTSLLHLSEVQSNQPTTNFEVFRIDEIIQQIAIRLNQTEKTKRIKIEYKNVDELSEHSFEILGNKLWIEIAISNILKNALKFSGDQPVDIFLSHTKKYSLIEVQDKGIGMNARDLEKIYTPFFRGENSRHIKGYGIGLALTRNIIKLHKGKIEISSREKKGTTVRMFFHK